MLAHCWTGGRAEPGLLSDPGARAGRSGVCKRGRPLARHSRRRRRLAPHDASRGGIDARDFAAKEEQLKAKIGGAAHTLGEQLGLTDDLAEKLTFAGGASAELVVDMPADYIAGALGITDAEAETILEKARALVASDV